MKTALLFLLVCCTFGNASLAFSSEQVELRFSWWGGKSRNVATLEALKAFEVRYPSIKVKAEYTGWDGYSSRVTTQLNSGTEADVIQTNWNWLTLLSRTGDGFYDLNKVSKEIGLEHYSPESLATTTVNGKVNAMPISSNVMLFYYNAHTWEKAGVPFPTTWDELRAAGQQFKEKLGDNYFPLVLSEQDALMLVRSYMYQKYQKEMIDVESKTFAWSHEELVEGLTFYKSLMDAHVAPNMKQIASFGKGINYEMKPWINGEWGGVYNWNALYTAEAGNLILPDKLVMGPYPMLPGAKDAGQFRKTALMYSISRHTMHPKEAALLLNFLLNEKEGVVPVGLERGAPLSQTGEKALRDAGIWQDNDPVIQGLAQSAKLPNASATLPQLEDGQFVTLFDNAREAIDYGKKTVDQAATEFEQQVNRILKRIMR